MVTLGVPGIVFGASPCSRIVAAMVTVGFENPQPVSITAAKHIVHMGHSPTN
jgi:hypothetical protein